MLFIDLTVSLLNIHCVNTINDVIDVTVLEDAVCVPSYYCHGYT